MKALDSKYHLEMRAADALKAALTEVSTIKIKEIRLEPPRVGRDSSLMICVDLFGQRHTLTCEVHSDGQPQQVRTTLEEFRTGDALCGESTMPIIFAPYLSPEAQALCKESKAGFVDLEGNARLALGEVFIVKRSLPHRSHHRSASAATWRPNAQEKLSVRSNAAHLANAQHEVVA
jgi:hypothetical protein